jgi:putative ATP-dependent endonuclease of the OLD family
MRLSSARIRNYHCLKDLTVKFDAVTSLIGPNDAGKSSVLRALDWFFNGTTALSEKDLSAYADPEDRAIEVEVTFTDFEAAERETIGDFFLPAGVNSLTVCRSWEDGEEEATCIVAAYPSFDSVRSRGTAAKALEAYRQLQKDEKLMLPAVSSKAKADTAMREWEQAHPEALVTQPVNAAALMGPKGVIAKFFEYVFAGVDMRAGEEARESKGSILSRLAASVDKKEFEDRIKELDLRIRKAREGILEEFNQKTDSVARELSREVSGLCSGREISIGSESKELRPSIELQLRVKHGSTNVELERQGHGFQRATMLGALLHLADRDAAVDRQKSILLAVEEPEIYQNPIQSRRLARALQERAENPGSRLSVLYATHSPIFISPLHPERVRRLCRRQSGKGPRETGISTYSLGALKKRVSEAYVPRKSLPRQVLAVMNEAFTEAFFAEAVILVEGETDKAVLDEVIARDGALERYGITVASASGKANLITAEAILSQLGIPSLTVFDSDSGNPGRQRNEEEAAAEFEKGRKLNRALLEHHRVLNEPDYPKGHLGSTLFAWDDNLEHVLGTTWTGWTETMEEVRSELDDRKTKRPALYRLTAMRCTESDCPDLAKVVGLARALVN